MRNLAADYGDRDFEEIENGLDKLFQWNSVEADEAAVILMSFYLGEHNGEEVFENIISRGPRTIPVIERYIAHPPNAVLERYPARIHLDRGTTVLLLRDLLEILKVQAGAREIGSYEVVVAPLDEGPSHCRLALATRPILHFPNDLVREGESYRGNPVLRTSVSESGKTIGIELMGRTGIERLDEVLLSEARQWEYQQRQGCGTAMANVVVYLRWKETSAGKP